MTNRLPILIVLWGSLVPAGCKSAASSTAVDTPPAAPALSPGPAGRWVYEAKVGEVDLQEAKPRELVLTEAARRSVNGTTVIELAVALDGQPLTEEEAETFGGAPFATFGQRLVLLARPKGPEGAVWMLYAGEQGPDDAAIAEALEQPPTWPLASAAREAKPPADDDERFDQALVYAKKIGGWDSICSGYVHPSPDSGDFYALEHCFAPDVGITSLFFESVWGSYDLTLTLAPAGFTLAP